MPSATQPIRPKPPAWASIIEVPTGVPGNKPNSSAAFLDNPLPKEKFYSFKFVFILVETSWKIINFKKLLLTFYQSVSYSINRSHYKYSQ